jgi:hypothetical protein
MTTVGFIGGSPQSTEGRVVAAVLVVSGFAMMTLVTARRRHVPVLLGRSLQPCGTRAVTRRYGAGASRTG